jgi:hypothetical protein
VKAIEECKGITDKIDEIKKRKDLIEKILSSKKLSDNDVRNILIQHSK